MPTFHEGFDYLICLEYSMRLQLLQPNDNGSLRRRREWHRYSSSINQSTVPSFDNAVLFRCSRSGSLMFNAFFFEIGMECLVQEFRASVSTDKKRVQVFLNRINNLQISSSQFMLESRIGPTQVYVKQIKTSLELGTAFVLNELLFALLISQDEQS
ncbi:hypothetical protein Tco_1067839 [Tanacetum coccineum]|uniref:Uncharacterized protein n=1 Tax=Tanacetum coccineum TaxID=301880 RepID=A0ABQ5HFY0_9ASTR